VNLPILEGDFYLRNICPLRPVRLRGQRFENLFLDSALQVSAAQPGVETALHYEVNNRVGKRYLNALLLEPGADDAVQLLADDLPHVRFGEWVEDHDLVNAGQEFGRQAFMQLGQHCLLHLFDRYFCGAEAQPPLEPQLAAQVAGHDHRGVAEVHRPPLSVGQPPVVENLEKEVEHGGVSFLYLIQQDHAKGLAAYPLGELAALAVAHVARRRAGQPRDGEVCGVLGHVQADQPLLVAE